MVVTYTVIMARDDGRKPKSLRIVVDFPRPDNWKDATYHEREEATMAALGCDIHDHHRVKEAIVDGYHYIGRNDPICECVVQAGPERDRLLILAGNICRRCRGPLP